MNNYPNNIIINKLNCEAFDCFNSAETKISLAISKEKWITLFVCTDCVKKFGEQTNE